MDKNESFGFPIYSCLFRSISLVKCESEVFHTLPKVLPLLEVLRCCSACSNGSLLRVRNCPARPYTIARSHAIVRSFEHYRLAARKLLSACTQSLARPYVIARSYAIVRPYAIARSYAITR